MNLADAQKKAEQIVAEAKQRAERIAKRDSMGLDEAVKHVEERDEGNRKRYKKIYSIDIDNTDDFDATLSSGIYRPEELADICMKIIEVRDKHGSN